MSCRFEHLGGTIREREPKQFHITHIPAAVRSQDRQVIPALHCRGNTSITFERHEINIADKARAEFICPGHPLLGATTDVILEQFVEILANGSVRTTGSAPHLDYRPATEAERAVLTQALEADWLKEGLEARAISYAISNLVPRHFEGVKTRRAVGHEDNDRRA